RTHAHPVDDGLRLETELRRQRDVLSERLPLLIEEALDRDRLAARAGDEQTRYEQELLARPVRVARAPELEEAVALGLHALILDCAHGLLAALDLRPAPVDVVRHRVREDLVVLFCALLARVGDGLPHGSLLLVRVDPFGVE